MTFFDERSVILVNSSYPGLFSYVAAVPIAVNAGLSSVLDHSQSLAVKVGLWYNFCPLKLIWPARLLSFVALLVAAGLVAWSAKATRRPDHTWVGPLALLCSPALLAYGAYGLPDIVTMAFTAASLSMSLRFLESNDRGNFRTKYLLLGAV